MNVYDSEQIALRLAGLGYQQTASLEKADLVMVNTCTIRAKAEQKAFSFLGRLARLKKKKPGLIQSVGPKMPCNSGTTWSIRLSRGENRLVINFTSSGSVGVLMGPLEVDGSIAGISPASASFGVFRVSDARE